MDKKKELDDIAHKVRLCTKCDLCKTAINAVPGTGNPNAKIVIIGEAPGKNEDIQGVPFVGQAGKLLDFMLRQIKLSRDEVWIGNIIKHRPPKNRDPFPQEIAACQPYLTAQLKIIKPILIVTLGRFAMNYFIPNEKISTAKGKLFEINGNKVYPVYHPAAGLRNSKMKAALISDFLNIPNVLEDMTNEKPQKTDIIGEDLTKSKLDEQIGLL